MSRLTTAANIGLLAVPILLGIGVGTIVAGAVWPDPPEPACYRSIVDGEPFYWDTREVQGRWITLTNTHTKIAYVFHENNVPASRQLPCPEACIPEEECE